MYNFQMVTIVANHKLQENTLMLSNELAVLLKLKQEENLLIHVGQNYQRVTISISNTTKNKKHLHLSPQYLKRLYIHHGEKYGIGIQTTGIHIGPVVGIMARAGKDRSRPLGGQSRYFEKMIMTAKKIGEICYGFDIKNIDWNKNVVYGYTHTGNRWIKGKFPLPDVVYPRDMGYSSYTLKARNLLAERGCKFLNPALIGKWQTYQIISENPELCLYLPDTALVTSFNYVDQVIRKYHSVYMKPVNGSKGRNIIKVIKKDGLYRYQYQLRSKNHRGTARNINKLKQSLKPIMGNRKYIIQRQINLLRSHGNILDVRVMVQKDHTGNWSITGKACRIGQNGSITSNLATGGRASKLETILAQQFPNIEDREIIQNEVNSLAVKSARALEVSVGDIGELGIDIGIDTAGQVWFIEANLKPARQVFILIKDYEARRKSIEKPLLYSRYLAGFKEREE